MKVEIVDSVFTDENGKNVAYKKYVCRKFIDGVCCMVNIKPMNDKDYTAKNIIKQFASVADVFVKFTDKNGVQRESIVFKTKELEITCKSSDESIALLKLMTK